MATRSGSGRPGRDPRTRARVRPGRREPEPPPRARVRLRVWLPAAVAVLLVAVVLGGTLGSPWLDVTRVDVAGAAPDTRADVERAAGIAPGTSLVWLDGDVLGGGVAERVRALPRVASVDVGRSWPHTLAVTVVEREPVLAVPGTPGAGGAGFALVDGSGFAYRTIARVPRGVPVLRLPLGAVPGPEDPSTLAAVRVLSSLAPDLRRRVVEVRATGPFDVALALGDGRTVRWGGDAENARKGAVLRALLTRPGSIYDVSSPDLAMVR